MTPNLFNNLSPSSIHIHILHHISPTNFPNNIRIPILRISKQLLKVFLPHRGRDFSSFLQYWRWKQGNSAIIFWHPRRWGRGKLLTCHVQGSGGYNEEFKARRNKGTGCWTRGWILGLGLRNRLAMYRASYSINITKHRLGAHELHTITGVWIDHILLDAICYRSYKDSLILPNILRGKSNSAQMRSLVPSVHIGHVNTLYHKLSSSNVVVNTAFYLIFSISSV